MRILHATAGVPGRTDGPSVALRSLSEALRHRGHGVRVLGVNPAPDARGCGDAFRVHGFDLDPWPLAGRVGASQALRRALRSAVHRSELVHAHGLWRLHARYAEHTARTLGKPLVMSPHGMLGSRALRTSGWKKQLFWRLVHRRLPEAATVWHAASQKELHDLRAFGIEAPVALIPLGARVPELPHAESPRETRDAIYLGRLDAQKRLELLLAQWGSVSARFPAWRLRIVGPLDTPYALALRERWCTPDIEFLGEVSGEERYALLQSAELFVQPSPEESFCLAIAEALACGTPVLCTQGTPWAGVAQRHCGWWVPARTSALAGALEDALSQSPSTLATMGARGREWVSAELTWEHAADRLEALYAWVLGRGPLPDFVYSPKARSIRRAAP